MTQIDADAVRAKYRAAGQEQVFAFWDKLDQHQRRSLLEQAAKLDVERVNDIYRRAMEGERLDAQRLASKHADLAPPPKELTVSYHEADADAAVAQEQREAHRVGLEAITQGKLGVLLLAGGQGTRLGSSAPKGCYDIGLASHKSLFQLQAERIRRLEQLAGCAERGTAITWFVMTSGPTRKPTQDFFAEKRHFGLKPENVVFFEQGTLPCLTPEGKIMLESPSVITSAPDGNGGLYAALRAPLDDGGKSVVSLLRERNIDYLHTYGVDNCLVRVGDPTFVGTCIRKRADVGVKTVVKTEPHESVGVVALRDGRWSVLEYSEIPKSLAEARETPGAGGGAQPQAPLLLRAANIVNHFYTAKFLCDEVESIESRIAYHVARKKIPTVEPTTGAPVKPSSPNGLKLELFIFDVFPFVEPRERLVVHEVTRRSEFSALKNAAGTGVDDAQTSVRDLRAEWARWLEAAGVEVVPRENHGGGGSATTATGAGGAGASPSVEISPLVSYAGEGLEAYRGGKVREGDVLEK